MRLRERISGGPLRWPRAPMQLTDSLALQLNLLSISLQTDTCPGTHSPTLLAFAPKPMSSKPWGPQGQADDSQSQHL